MSDAVERMMECLAGGRYRIIEVREVQPLKERGKPAQVAVLENVSGDPDDTRETVLVHLKDPEDLNFALGHLAAGPQDRGRFPN